MTSLKMTWRGRAAAVVAGAALLAGGLAGAPARADSAPGPVVYVSDLQDNEVLALDADTGATLATIPVAAPQLLAVNPAGTELWVSGQNGISIVDTSTDAVLTLLSVPGGGGGAITFNQAGTRAYVEIPNSDEVIDTATRTFLGYIAADYGADQVVSSADRSVVYAAQDRTDGVAVVDPATDDELTTISLNGTPGFGGGAALAINPSGTRLFAAVPDQQTVFVVDTATDSIVATIPIPEGATNIVMDATGTHAYIVGTSITVIDTATDAVTATLPAPPQAGGIATLNPAGTVLYTTAYRSTDAYAVDTTSGAVLDIYSGLTWASGLAVNLADQPTTTALSISPAGPVTAGTPVTLTAHISPATAGTVQFSDATNPLGAPVTVAAGTATLTTSALGSGVHTLTAAFTPTAATSLASTSAPVTFQVNPPGIAVDQTVTANGSGTVTTTSITTSGPRLLVAYVGADGPATKQSATVTGAGLTWTLVARANKTGTGTAEIWTATAPAAFSSATITSALKNNGYDQALTVIAYTGASGIGASATADKAKGAPTITVTTTHANSWVFGGGEDYTGATARTLGPNQSLISQWIDSGPGETFWTQDPNTSTPTAGTTVTLNDTAPTNDTWNMAAAEVLPATS